MKMFPLSHQKAQLNNREERLPSPIIRPGVKGQPPDTASLGHNTVSVPLRQLGYERCDRGLRRSLGLPVRYPPVGIGRCYCGGGRVSAVIPPPSTTVSQLSGTSEQRRMISRVQLGIV